MDLSKSQCFRGHGELQKRASWSTGPSYIRSCLIQKSCRNIPESLHFKCPFHLSARSPSQHPQRIVFCVQHSVSERRAAHAPPGPNEDDPVASHVSPAAHAPSRPNEDNPIASHESLRPEEGLSSNSDNEEQQDPENEQKQAPYPTFEGLSGSAHMSTHRDDNSAAASSDIIAAALDHWNQIPGRYKLILATSTAFVICNMDKVNLSIAIIPMSRQLHWNASMAGLVQSSFFWGYTVSQLPGGWLAKRFSGEVVLGVGVLLWSLATAVVPMTASFIPGLLFSRFIVGLGEGVSPSAATDMIARHVPVTERSRAVAFVFNGLNVGSVIGLVAAPFIIEQFGWELVFYIFGVLGIVWCVGFPFFTESNWLWMRKGQQLDLKHLKTYDVLSTSNFERKEDSHASSHSQSERIPWKAFFRSPAVWAMIYTHFCGNWGHYCNLAWLPTYFSEELNLDLTNAALVAVIPPLGGMFVSGLAATMADHMISRGVEATFVRKLCQTIAFVCPTAGMTVTSLDIGLSPWAMVSIITSTLALSSFALGGLYCTHQDISPKYASILLGITNTAGAIPGILGVFLTGYLLDHTHSWTAALFAPCIFFWITGAIVWNAFASSEPQTFED